MERNGIDKLKKVSIILPLVVAVIFNSSVAAIDCENNSKLSCGIDSYYVKDIIAQDNHIWFLLHDNSIGKDAVACINEKTLELQACYRSGEDLEDEMIIQNMSVQPNGSVWLDLFYPKNPKGLQTSVYKGYKRDKIEMRGDRAKISDFPLYLNTVAGGLDCRDQTIGGFSFVVKIYAVPVVEIIGQLLYLLGRYGFNAQFSDCL